MIEDLRYLEPLIAIVMKGKFSPQDVKEYYNRLNRKYQDIYGDVIQAFRPKKTEDLLKYISQSAGIKWKMDLLDAGCGVCGPAIYFARQMHANVEAVTISEEQWKISEQNIEKYGLKQRIHARVGDFHELDALYPGMQFDAVLFLESLGHASEPAVVLRSAIPLLKKGGFIYIKDFFRRTVHNENMQQKIDTVIGNMNENYNYNTLDLLDVLKELRLSNMDVEFVKKFDFKDDTGVRARFETDLQIDNFDGLDEFEPAEWLEIKVTKRDCP
ncbi:MAG: class I SAM-dependent methyltransferase [Bacteroidetes bacterium]|nr:class I SAM-dependent methyltransferase [Bacteroidota bacterium]